jgi:hypothetical protein
MLTVGAGGAKLPADGNERAQLIVAGARPRLVTDDGDGTPAGDDVWEAWQQILERLLQRWV